MSESGKERLILNELQRRVLGVLIEKSMTTPDQYPLSLNSLVSGCNQKSNRNPVVSFDEGEVANTIQELIHKSLACYSDVMQGSRVNRFEHTVIETLGWGPRERAVLGELMLRGPQTVGEIRTRASRMHQMQDLPFVQGILDSLAADDPPQVAVLPRVPGQSTVRYTHLFHPEGEQPNIHAPTPSLETTNLGTVHTHSPALDSPVAPPAPPVQPATDPKMLQRMSDLEDRVAQLESVITSLTQ